MNNIQIKWLINEKEFNEIKENKYDTYINSQVKITPAIYFSKIGKTKELFSVLKEDGKRVHDKTSTGKTTLMFASQYNNINCVRLLVLAGANINATDEHNSTALMYATSMGNKEVVKFLLEKGADKDIKDENGLTAFDIATKNHDEEIIGILLVDKDVVQSQTKKIVITDIEYI